MKLNNLTIGADPEMFLYNKNTNSIISAVDLIPGSKQNPFKPKDLPKGFGLQTDNVLIEFNIPPCKLMYNSEDFTKNILTMKQYIRNFVKRINPDFDIKCQASAELDDSELQSEQSRQFGCDPDWNAYTTMQNSSPVMRNPNLRSAGFHIHIGYKNPKLIHSIEIIKYLDAYVGVTSLLFDKDCERRKLYGSAGNFRVQRWGVEYRTLSSAMMNSKNTLDFIYLQTLKAIEAFEEQVELPDPHVVRRTINSTNMEDAHSLIVNYNLI